MKDNDEIMREISEDYPVLSDEEKDRIFNKSEQKLISEDVTGEQVSGVETYKPQIYKYIGIAAAFLLVCGGGTALYMNVRPSRSPESFNVTEETTEESIQETAEEFTEETADEDVLQTIESLIKHTVELNYFINHPLLDKESDDKLSFNILYENHKTVEKPVIFYPLKGYSFENFDDIKNYALKYMTENYYDKTIKNHICDDKTNVSQEEIIDEESFFGESLHNCIISYNGVLYGNNGTVGLIYTYDFDLMPAEIIEENGDNLSVRKIISFTNQKKKTIECEYNFELVKTENGWRVNDLYYEPIDESETEEPVTDTTEPTTEITKIPEEITDDIITTEDMRFDYERAREILNKQNQICHEIEDNLDETDYVEYEIEPDTHAKYLRYTGSKYNSIDEIMADFDDIFTDEYMRSMSLIPNENSEIDYRVFIEENGNIYENVARTVSFTDFAINEPYEMNLLDDGTFEAKYKIDDYRTYIMNFKAEDGKYKLNRDYYMYSKRAAFFLQDDTLTSESATFTIKNNTDEELSFGMEFTLEKVIDGAWTVINYDQYFNALAGIIEPYGSAPFTADFVNPLDAGQYRITKDISGEKYIIEFEIQ